MHWEYIKEDWKITISGHTYDLTHLQRHIETIVIPKQGKFAELSFQLQIKFTSHCVTEGKERYENKQYAEPCVLITDEGGKDRCFSKVRYELSKTLPEIMKGLIQKQCYFTGTGRNYLVIEHLDSSGAKSEYHVFFTLKKKGQRVEIYVESAYIPEHKRKLHQKIKGRVLLGKAYRGGKIKAPHSRGF